MLIKTGIYRYHGNNLHCYLKVNHDYHFITRPREISAKQRVSGFREVIPVKKKVTLRFGDKTGDSF